MKIIKESMQEVYEKVRRYRKKLLWYRAIVNIRKERRKAEVK